MNGKVPYQRIIFGLKIKQLRQKRGMSFAELSKATGMSVSYLNEIEKGKKFPKDDKVAKLAEELETTESHLRSVELDAKLAPVTELLQSNFLNELPLDLFGIELGKVAEIIASAPLRVGAFISTLLDLSRSHAVREENFFFAALRSYLELNNNYFSDLEQAAARFLQQQNIPVTRPLPPQLLAEILEDQYDYQILPAGLEEHPEFEGVRSVYLPAHKQLLLNGGLNNIQTSFQYGKEIAFQELQLKERSLTSSVFKPRSFEEVLNHAFATYFSVAVHLPEQDIIERTRDFLNAERWDPKAFLGIMQHYNASPEMFYHRLTNIFPQHFGISRLFFLRFIHHPEEGSFDIDRELHLSKRHQPHGNAMLEHYCRRWVSISLLNDLSKMQAEGAYLSDIVRAQRSRFVRTGEEYLCLTMARPGVSRNSSRSGGADADQRNVSVTLGLLINDELRAAIRWLDDPAIQYREVNQTCERCAIADCQERVVPPKVIERRNRLRIMQQHLTKLNQKI